MPIKYIAKNNPTDIGIMSFLNGEKTKPAPSRKPTDYLNFDDHLSPDALEFGKIVCVTFQGFPVGMSDDDRKDFATIQLELKKKNSKVDYLPWHKRKEKGCRTGWRVEDLVPVERYDEKQKNNPEPVVAEPVEPEPPVVEPEPPVVEPEPPVVEPEPEVVEPKVPEPAVVEAEVPEPAVVEAEVPEPAVVEAEVPEPAVVEAEVVEPSTRSSRTRTSSSRTRSRSRPRCIKNYKVIDIQPLEVKFLKDTSLKCVKIWPRIPGHKCDRPLQCYPSFVNTTSGPKERLHFRD
ncbi:TBC1D23 [Mytilus edulis]|uniref:TBC1D23 n=1 Tax=Mytilus edulis TaxID=6550 RepID=A0A8S3T3N6_MYTED|nr:TBC1D23 [Mytilus edulis]